MNTRERQNRERQNQARRVLYRVKKAFTALEGQGFITDRGSHCCQGCTQAELDDSKSSYVFYHKQDRETLTRSGTLYLAYGTFDEKADDWAPIGEQVRDAMLATGLLVTWDGTPSQRIMVSKPEEVN